MLAPLSTAKNTEREFYIRRAGDNDDDDDGNQTSRHLKRRLHYSKEHQPTSRNLEEFQGGSSSVHWMVFTPSSPSRSSHFTLKPKPAGFWLIFSSPRGTGALLAVPGVEWS